MKQDQNEGPLEQGGWWSLTSAPVDYVTHPFLPLSLASAVSKFASYIQEPLFFTASSNSFSLHTLGTTDTQLFHSVMTPLNTSLARVEGMLKT